MENEHSSVIMLKLTKLEKIKGVNKSISHIPDESLFPPHCLLYCFTVKKTKRDPWAPAQSAQFNICAGHRPKLPQTNLGRGREGDEEKDGERVIKTEIDR